MADQPCAKSIDWLYNWCAGLIPSVYDESLTYYEQLAKVLTVLKETITHLGETDTNVEKLKQLYNELSAEFEKFKNGEYDEFYQQRIMEWIHANVERLVKEALMTGVWFGLTDDGYFCAYKPESWSDIEFDTGMVYGRSDYGRLILRANVDGQGVINNTYRYQIPGASPALLDEMIADLELQGSTLWTHMDSPVIGGA